MKSLLLYALWFASQTEYRGKGPVCLDDWEKVEYGRCYGRCYGKGRAQLGVFNGKKDVYLDRRVAKWLVGQADWEKQLSCKLYKFPLGYVYIMDKKPPLAAAPAFWLDEFNALNDK